MTQDPRWALNTTQTVGPRTGQPTRVQPSAGERNTGYYETQLLPAEHFNFLLGVHGDVLYDHLLFGWQPTEHRSLSGIVGGASIDWLGWIEGNPATNSWPVAIVQDNLGNVFSTWDFGEWILLPGPGAGVLNHAINIEGNIFLAGSSAIRYAANTLRPAAAGSGAVPGSWTTALAAACLRLAYDPVGGVAVGVDGTTTRSRSASLPGGWATAAVLPFAADEVVWSAAQSQFVAARTVSGAPLQVATSPDGTTWTDRSGTAPADNGPSTVAGVNGLAHRERDGAWYLVGNAGIYKSLDAISWTAIASGAGFTALSNALGFPAGVVTDNYGTYLQCWRGVAYSVNDSEWHGFYPPNLTVASSPTPTFVKGPRNIFYSTASLDYQISQVLRERIKITT